MHVKRVGILGGGQLALMLASAAQRMGLRPVVLAENSFSPAAQVFTETVFGGLTDDDALNRFFAEVDQVVFENEFVDCAHLARLAIPDKTVFAPGLDVIAKFQDKLKQKEILQNLNIPNAEYFILDFDKPLSEEITRGLNTFAGSCVLKWSRMGYDGKGVLVINATDDLSRAEKFCLLAKNKGSLVYVERKVPFKRELALIGVRSAKGDFVSYPLVVSEQRNGVCARVFGPATSCGVSPRHEQLAQEYARKLAEAAGLVGAFGVEFFEDEDESLLVNEVAPRVHNSGHYTQTACVTDQFENHWRAVLGMPLGAVDAKPCFAMLNILGPKLKVKRNSGDFLPKAGAQSHLTWYHKQEIKPGRKLGHLNGVGNSIDRMPELLSELTTIEQKWVEQICQ